jgi:hypothetical protein
VGLFAGVDLSAGVTSSAALEGFQGKILRGRGASREYEDTFFLFRGQQVDVNVSNLTEDLPK